MTLGQLKSLNLDNMLEVEEVVHASAQLRAICSEFEMHDVPVPEWTGRLRETLDNEIESRLKSARLAEARKIETELEGLKTTQERKTELQKRLASIQGQLGIKAGRTSK